MAGQAQGGSGDPPPKESTLSICTARLGGQRWKYMVVSSGMQSTNLKGSSSVSPRQMWGEPPTLSSSEIKTMKPKAAKRRLQTRSSPQSTEKLNDNINRIHFLSAGRVTEFVLIQYQAGNLTTP